MKCPSCHSVELIKSERQGFTIDYCSNCRGMWFERAEIEKILKKILYMDLSTPEAEYVEPESDTSSEHTKSAIMDRMLDEKELHHAHLSKGKHHWMHRLFD